MFQLSSISGQSGVVRAKWLLQFSTRSQTENADQMTIAKLNVDENPDIAMRYQVMSIPTMIVFNGGEAVHRIVGAKSKSALLEEFGTFLGNSH